MKNYLRRTSAGQLPYICLTSNLFPGAAVSFLLNHPEHNNCINQSKRLRSLNSSWQTRASRITLKILFALTFFLSGVDKSFALLQVSDEIYRGYQ